MSELSVSLTGNHKNIWLPLTDRLTSLLVEDNEDARQLVALTLAEYRLIIARNFAEGLRQARQRYFDLYILDNLLPDGSGVELCYLIREFDPHAPIVFYSAEAASKNSLRAALRVRAMRAFLAAGGTRGDFARQWVSLRSRELR